jgi:ribonuclease G
VSKRIVVNVGLLETRVAVQERNLLTEIYLERHRHRSIVGSVYKGTVTNVLPGMQAAFVDIGLSKDAFLYAGDYTANLTDAGPAMLAGADDDADPDAEAEGEGDEEPKREATGPIEEMLSRNQEVLVQVSKESLGTKGARVTSFISIPGRYVVYMPQARHVGVSRRIRDERERDRLRAALRSLKLPPGGFILRTNAEGKGEEEFAHDVEFLSRLWSQIQARFEQAKSPAALHEEMDLTFRVVRDLFSPEVDEFVVDDRAAYDKCVGYVQALVPALEDRVRLSTERAPIFDAFGIEKDIEKALRRRVWLKSGGYIVIDHTEALVSIDVNTGRYTGKKDPEKTILKTNLEAAREIARQIRLRDIGGIIVCDFIDMESRQNRDRVLQELRSHLGRDRARTKAFAVSELGLVEMTRQRVRPSLWHSMTTECPACAGTGRVFTPEAVARRLERSLKRAGRERRERQIAVRVHPDVALYLLEEEPKLIHTLGKATGLELELRDDPMMRLDEFRLMSRPAGRDVTELYAVA